MELLSPERRSEFATSASSISWTLRLQCRVGRQIRDFRLLRRDNGLVLQGHAHTYYAKQLAQHAVMEVLDGLPIVANEIEVT